MNFQPPSPLAELCREEGITMTFRSGDNPDPLPPFAIGMTGTLAYATRRLVLPFFMIQGWPLPQEADVLRVALFDTIALAEVGPSFEAWAARFQLNPDSRTQYARWERVVARSSKVKEFLGKKYATFLTVALQY